MSETTAAAVGLRALPLAALAALSACAVGPNFKRPAPPQPGPYFVPDKESSSQAADSSSAHGPQQAAGAALVGQWWQIFHCAPLDDTLRLAIANSPTFEQAKATLDQAREQITIAAAAFFPKLGGNLGGSRETISGTPPLPTFTAGLSASYALDIFGGTRRTVEQESSLAEMQRYELAAAYLTLTGNVVTQALNIASARLTVATTLELIDEDRRNLQLTKRELELGAIADIDELTAETQLAADEATLPPLRQQLGAARDAMAALVGRSPGEYSAPDFDVTQLKLPDTVPVSLPSSLVRQRPDILAAEEQLHAASAAIGVAISQEFPSLTLSASLSRDALIPGGLFHDGSNIVEGGGSLTAPLFEGGALRAQVRAARDEYIVEETAYRQTVLTGLQQVADDLRSLENDAAHVAAAVKSVDISKKSLDLQRKSYLAGKSTILDLITAERTYAQARLTLATAQVSQYQDIANLFVALGGGWWEDPASAAGGLK
jgi:NodT family efflux transporter outer membrane factor (OMF) lipoprotein